MKLKLLILSLLNVLDVLDVFCTKFLLIKECTELNPLSELFGLNVFFNFKFLLSFILILLAIFCDKMSNTVNIIINIALWIYSILIIYHIIGIILMK